MNIPDGFVEMTKNELKKIKVGFIKKDPFLKRLSKVNTKNKTQ